MPFCASISNAFSFGGGAGEKEPEGVIAVGTNTFAVGDSTRVS